MEPGTPVDGSKKRKMELKATDRGVLVYEPHLIAKPFSVIFSRTLISLS